MVTIPKLGTRVRYTNPRNGDTVTGTVERVLPGIGPTGKLIRRGARNWYDYWYALVRIDKDTIPDWWPYDGRVFAPALSDIRPIV